MSRSLITPGTFSAIGLAFVATAFACENSRETFDKEPSGFEVAPEVDAGECPLQCSLDGRSVLRSCTGEVVETCPNELACGGARCQEPCAAAAEDNSSNGCEFYLQAPPTVSARKDSCYAAFVVNTTPLPLTISLDREGEALDLSGAMFRTTPGDATLIPHTGPISPDESVIVFLSDHDPAIPLNADEPVPCPDGVKPAVFSGTASSRTGFGSSFHLKSSAPVSLVSIFPFGGAKSFLPSATLHMPVVTWGKEHILVNGWEGGGPSSRVVASEDGTEITLIANKTIQSGVDLNGGPADTPLKYTLDKGQYLQIVQAEELGGSTVLSNKPTSMFGGNACANIPIISSACDTLWQQIPSYDQWGSEYVGVGYRPRTASQHELMPYRIVAAHDGTRLEYEPTIPPGAPTEMNARDSVTFPVGIDEPFVVRTQDADHPIYVAAYMQGLSGQYYGSPSMRTGDPEFVNVIPAAQWRSSYSFYADPTYDETSLVVIRGKQHDKFEDVWLECAGTLEGWTPVGARGDYEFVRVDLQRNRGAGQSFGDKVCQTGLHRMKSDGPFTATIWGWSVYASYAYPGGMALRKLVDKPLLPIQ